MTDAQVATQATDEAGPGEPAPARPWWRPPWLGPAALGAALVAANVCIAADVRYPVIVPALGAFLLVGLPAVLLMMKVDWHADSVVERLGYSLVTVVLILMFAGLLVNTLLPPVGISDALGPVTVIVIGDALVALLLWWRRDRIAWRPARPLWSVRLTIQEKTVTRLGIAAVAIAVIGANRLNNGAGDGVAVAGLALTFVTLLLVFIWRDRLDPGVITFTLFVLAMAVLFMTSMRGWYTTGHDIQREYRVFELTRTNGNWQISRFKDAYNACLSITILPTMLWEATKIHDPYVYKVLYQSMFALAAPLVYRLSLRFTTPAIALIGVTYLLCFPTFSNDMPFENRQEIAFLFILAMLLVLTSEGMPRRRKQLWIAAFSLGMIVSHYSSALVFIATVVATVVLGFALRRGGRWLAAAGRRLRLPRTRLGGADVRPVLGWANVTVLLLGAFVWIGLITQTGSTFTGTVGSALSSIGSTFSFSAKSSDVAYNLFSFSQPSNSQLMSEYRKQTVQETGDRAGYYPLAALNARARTSAVDISAKPTALGRGLDRAGVNVTDVQTILHGAMAKLLQLLVLVGLLAILFYKDPRFRIRREPYLFAFATLLALGAEVVVPVVSENYGILRAFMQGLLILSPILAYGSVIVFSRLGSKWATRLAIGLALILFVNLSGLVPQLLGGYDQDLSLNNSGLYYNIYYPHAEEIVAINWLRRHIPPRIQTSVQSEVVTDQFEFQRLKIYSGINLRNDIYPTLLRRNSYVYLSWSTVRNDLATVAYKGNLVTYKYPLGYLLRVKDELFANGGAEVFR